LAEASAAFGQSEVSGFLSKLNCSFGPKISHWLTAGKHARRFKIENQALGPQQKEQEQIMKQTRTQTVSAKRQTRSASSNEAAVPPVRPERAFGPGSWRKAGVLAALALLAAAASPARADGGSDQPDRARSLVFPPQAHPYGLSFQEWAARYWQRTLSLPIDAASYAAPLSDGQSGQVWVIAGPLNGPTTATVQFSIPEGKSMLISPITYWADNANCPSFTDFTVDDLRGQVAAGYSQVTETSCTIDGVTIPGLSNPQDSPYLFDSTVFSYTLPDHDTYPTVLFGATCIPNGTTIDGAVAEGEFLMIKPLPVGQHIIHGTVVVGPAASPSLVVDVTYVITVTAGD
jgi:hypothetical protein